MVWDTPGRVMDLTVGNHVIVENVDVFKEVGKFAAHNVYAYVTGDKLDYFDFKPDSCIKM